MNKRIVTRLPVSLLCLAAALAVGTGTARAQFDLARISHQLRMRAVFG